ncbi:MAG: hypothetical protein MUF18_01035 [Fimbriiglobus sp.]|jgi:hypothetical protein|nr:hypothetical protein [Fimbriiglobus sp.]
MDAATSARVSDSLRESVPTTLSERAGHPALPNLDLLLDALKTALADPREHRLFQSGKLPGLFRSRYGPPAEAALYAIKEGLVETVRTEAKGRLIVEWVRVTPKGVGFVHDHDSPKAVLSDLKQLIGETRGGIPLWMADVRTEITKLSTQFEERSREMTARLDDLARRVDAALRRIDTAPKLADPVAKLVPWGETALEYLDRRSAAGAGGPCSLGELFHLIRQTVPAITVPEFHAGLRRLHDTRAIRLSGSSAPAGLRADPEYAMLVGAELCSFVSR